MNYAGPKVDPVRLAELENKPPQEFLDKLNAMKITETKVDTAGDVRPTLPPTNSPADQHAIPHTHNHKTHTGREPFS